MSRPGRRRALQTALATCCTGALLLPGAPAVADETRDSQWALNRLQAERSWQESTGEGVTVAVIDSGVDASHPDLRGQVLPGKTFGGSGDAREDSEGHGTAMAGIIAGHGHGAGRADGVKGLAPDSWILPVRLPNITRSRVLARHFPEAIRWAADHDADVINMSFGWPGASRAERSAVEYAQKKGAVLVAGMDNLASRSTDTFPASAPGVLGTAGIGRDGKAWEKSEYGPPVAVSAPAEQIVSTRTTEPGGYGYASGNSDATAYVSATAALVRAKHPDLTAGQVVNRIVATAKHPEGKNRDEHYGFGVIAPYAALTANVPLGPPEGPFLKGKPDTGDLTGAQPADRGSDLKRVAVFGGLGVGLLGLVAAVVMWGVRRWGRAGG